MTNPQRAPRVAAGAVILAIALASCATEGSTGSGQPGPTGREPQTDPSAPRSTAEPSPPPEDEAPGEPPQFESPPPVTVSYGQKSIELDAYSFCYGNVCADGMPPDPSLSVGSPNRVRVDFPLDGWSFQATFEPAGQRCGRAQTVELEATSSGSLVLEPLGYAGTYEVTLFGRGDGDLVTQFQWATPSDGPLPHPEARLAVLAGDPDEVDSYGVELSVSNLAETPDNASATVTVTAANKESLTFEAKRAIGCQPEGSVYWDGPDAQGLAAAELGPSPFTYTVALDLDGVRYSATATWPADVIKGNEPSVALIFRPALPTLTPR